MKKKMHVVSNTHWDREHRHSFQYTRLMLVKLMDDLIEIMEKDKSYKYFTLDGQTIILDDYLEVRPEMRQRLTKLIQDGRILIGPWYSLVDCYSVNPESIVRNLLYGDKISKKFGKPMKIGYSIFSFGQIAQLPQIYDGFGIKDIMFYKGANAHAFPKSEFIWSAPDGTEAIATRLGKEKRWNFYFAFTVPVVLGGNAFKPGWESSYDSGQRLVHLIDKEHSCYYAKDMQMPIKINRNKILGAVEELIDDTKDSVSENIKLGFDGTDFIAAVKDIPEALHIANEMQNDMEFVHSNPVEYFNDFRDDIDINSLQRYEGEMRFGPVDSLHSETLGNNIELKLIDTKIEKELISYAEPLSVISYMINGKYPFDELAAAWRYLFQAHAHDSIHGSGDPQIKLDNINRFMQIGEMNKYLIKSAVENIALNVNTDNCGDDIFIMIINPTNYKRDEAVTLHIDLPRKELVKDFWLEDNGERVLMYSHGTRPVNFPMMGDVTRPKTVLSDRADVDAYIKDIPAFGYKIIRLKRIKGSVNDYPTPFPPGIFPYNPIAKSGNILDNGCIRAEIQPDGRINVYDYKTKREYKGLHYFEDTGCSGDFWVHREPQKNSVVSSVGMPAKISIIRNSGIKATIRVHIDMEIPKSLTETRIARSEENVIVPIIYDVTLEKDSSLLKFETKIDNKAKEHMLTLLIDTGIDCEEVLTDAPFELRKRPVNNISDNNGKRGPEVLRFPIQSFVDVSDNWGGIQLITKGLKEVCAVKETGTKLNVTLLRAVGGTFPVHNDCFISFENENSNSLGEISYEYALNFHTAEEELCAVSECCTTPVLSAEIGSGKQGNLSEKESFIVSDNVPVTSIKLSEDKNGIILRLNNPTSEKKRVSVKFRSKILDAYLCNLLEEKTEDVKICENSADFDVDKYKIITLFAKLK
ncbi:MAG: hypothetical protein J6N52_12115 [Clostridia bacterium]|nr:hypothetical protein [Clostridia bacterium]